MSVSTWTFVLKSLGRDAAFIGPKENQFAVLEEDKTGLALYMLPGGALQQVENQKNGDAVEVPSADSNSASATQGPLPFMFETEVDRIFSTPIGR